MATGDPTWQCPFCGLVYFASNQIGCNCPNWLKMKYNDDFLRPISKNVGIIEDPPVKWLNPLVMDEEEILMQEKLNMKNKCKTCGGTKFLPVAGTLTFEDCPECLKEGRIPNLPLTFSELRKANVERCTKSFKHNLFQWSPLEWGGAMAGECGEACNLLKKMKRGENVDIKDIAHEIADMVVYADLLSAALGIDLGEAVREKFNIVSDRKNSKVKL